MKTLIKIYAICTLFVAYPSFALGTPKPKWFNGTEEQKASVSGWVNHLNACGKTQFKKESYVMFYNAYKSEVTFQNKNLMPAYDENMMEGSVTNAEANNYTFQVVNDSANIKNESAQQTEGKLVALMMAHALGNPLNYFDKCVENKKWVLMRDDRMGILYDTTEKINSNPPPDDQYTYPPICTSFLFDNNETTTHRLLSDKVSQAARDQFYLRLLNLKYNTISLQLVSNKDPQVKYDRSKKDFWRSELLKLKNDYNFKIVMWLRSDNAPTMTVQQWKDYVGVAIEDLDDLVDFWTAGIENDEYWSEAETKQVVEFMQSKSNKPIGVHTTRVTKASYAKPADVYFLQTGFGVSQQEVKNQLTQARNLFPTKDIVLAEYSKDGTSNDAIGLCNAGLSTKIPMGCMTGCKPDVVVPPPPSGCPEGGSKSNLIKPKSENDGKLVLVLSCEYLKNTESVFIGSERGRDTTNYTELPNGARVHFRFSKPGSNYGTQTIKMKLKNGSELCYTDNMGVRKENWKFKNCGGSTEPTDLFIDVKSDGTLFFSKQIADNLIREPKLFYLDGPNEGDKIAFNAVPNEKYSGSGTAWKLSSGNANYKGRHGVLFNTKAGAIDLTKIKWSSNIQRPSTKAETSNGVDTWGGFLKFDPGAN